MRNWKAPMDALGQPVSANPARRPERTTLKGRYIHLVPLDAAAHADALYEPSHGPDRESLWRYMSDGPFSDRAAFRNSLERKAQAADAVFFAIADAGSGQALGYASYLRIEPAHRVIEVGNIVYTPNLQRTKGATEAMYLMARHAFEDLGYRRYEWKCNSLNQPSRQAALRLGFRFEGIFRQHMIIKGRNRDTAWFAMLDSEWPERRRAFQRWLQPSNFDSQGWQKSPLERAPDGGISPPGVFPSTD